jgi:diacylglycerol kinase family enzyme
LRREDPRFPGRRKGPLAENAGVRLLVVMNPSSHDFEARRRWPRLEPRLARAASVTLLETEPDDARTIARVREELTRGHDRVLAIGGDGTLHLVVNAIFGAGLATLPEFAVIPFGTANNVAKSLGLPPRDLRKLTAVAVGSRLGRLDVARIKAVIDGKPEERVWVNCVGLGMDADVLVTRGNYRDLGGYLGYAAALAERSMIQRSMDLELSVDGKTFATRVYNLIVNNVPIYVGAMQMPGSHRDDGLLDVYLFDRLEYGSKVLSFAIKHADILKLGVSEALDQITENQRTFQGKVVRVRLAEPRRLQVDGEALGETSEILCDMAGHLRVTVP